MQQAQDLVDGLMLFRFGTSGCLLTSRTWALMYGLLLGCSHGLRFYGKLGRVRPVSQAYYESEKLFFCRDLVNVYFRFDSTIYESTDEPSLGFFGSMEILSQDLKILACWMGGRMYQGKCDAWHYHLSANKVIIGMNWQIRPIPSRFQ
jgi:hypothetical protein